MAKPDKPDTPRKPDSAKPQTSDPNICFSPQKTAALNAQYISISRKCAEVDEILIKKKNEFLLLGDKIKSLEKAKQQLEYDKKRIMCQISNEAQRYKTSPSPSPVKCKPEMKTQFATCQRSGDGGGLKICLPTFWMKMMMMFSLLHQWEGM